MENNSFSYLLPSVGEIFSGTPAGVSAIIWIIMYCFAMYAGNYVLSRYFKARKMLTVLRDFNDQLGEGLEEAAQFAEGLKSERNTRTVGLLLRDLIGNLVENPEYDGSEVGIGSLKYISSTQLGYYLNTRDVVPELFDNKFITFVPSLLTGFGVLGTFIGIQLGIGGLDFKVDDIENVTTSITMLLAGSTVAFMTSIWGVFFSLVFGVGEKTLLRKLQYGFQDVEYLIGTGILFISPENEIVMMRKSNGQILSCLEHISQQLADMDMNSLAAQIGVEMKGALESVESKNSSSANSEAVEEMGAIIISELRLIKEASEAKAGGSSLVNFGK